MLFIDLMDLFNSPAIKSIQVNLKHVMKKQKKVFILILLFLMIGRSSAAQIRQEQLSTKFPKAIEALSLLRNFPLLEQLLQVNAPWQGDPLLLKDIVLPEELTLAQGSKKYPLLYSAQRSASWPGMPVLGQLAYEVEYYVFDPARPVIKNPHWPSATFRHAAWSRGSAGGLRKRQVNISFSVRVCCSINS